MARTNGMPDFNVGQDNTMAGAGLLAASLEDLGTRLQNAMNAVPQGFIIPAGTGNGSTDDRDALATADADARTMVLPAGNTYLVGSNLTLSRRVFASGGLIKPASGVTVTINGPFEAGLYQVFDLSAGGMVTLGSGAVERVLPHWWGAVGDGLADATAALEASIDVATAAGARVYVPHGTYLIDTVSILNFTCDVFGPGTIKAGSAWDGQDPRTGFVRVNSGQRMSGVTVDGAGLVPAMNLVNYTGVVLEGCTLQNSARAVVIVSGGERNVIRGCKVSGGGQALNSSVVDQALFGDAIYAESTDRLLVEGCDVSDFTRIGIVVEGTSLDPSLDPLITHNRVHNGHDSTSTEWNAGIWLEDCDGGQVLGNNVWDMDNTSARSAGIVVSRGTTSVTRTYTVASNHVADAEVGIYVSDSAQVRGNTIREILEVGVYLVLADGGVALVEGNVFESIALDDSTAAIDNLVNALVNIDGDWDAVLLRSNVARAITYTDADCCDVFVTDSTGSRIVGRLEIDSWHNDAGEFRLNLADVTCVTDLHISRTTINLDGAQHLRPRGVFVLDDCDVLSAAAASNPTIVFTEMHWRGCRFVNSGTGSANYNLNGIGTSWVARIADCRFTGSWQFRNFQGSGRMIRLDNNIVEGQDAVGLIESLVGATSIDFDIILASGNTVLAAVNSGALVVHEDTDCIAVYNANVIDTAGTLYRNDAIPAALTENNTTTI